MRTRFCYKHLELKESLKPLAKAALTLALHFPCYAIENEHSRNCLKRDFI